MKRTLNVFDPGNYPKILPRHGVTYSYSPPGLVRVRGRVKEDTSLLDTTSDVWSVAYGGKVYNIDWNHEVLASLDDSLVALWQHHLTDEFQKKAPVTVYRKFCAFLGFCQELDAGLSLAALLTALCRLYVEGQATDFYFLRRFYKWGVARKIVMFDDQIQTILDSLPAPKRDPYASIYLQQSYMTPEQEARILMYIDARFAGYESLDDDNFSRDTFIEFRDAVLALLVYELAPRPMQVYTADRGDLHEIRDDGRVGYYSVRLVRNKNQHDDVKYTSRREVSLRLGKALKKLEALNEKLFSKCDGDSTPVFLNYNGERMSTMEVSAIVGQYLESALGEEHLDVSGATTPFRHHLGQALADQGAPPAVIADRLGHSTEVAARAYITATPNIAKIKTRALGENGTYRDLMHALMTGDIIERNDVKTEAQIVRGTIGIHYIEWIGACDVDGHCRTNPIYACYTCRKFHPFVDGPHDQVVKALQEEAISFVQCTADLEHSRPLLQLELAIESAKAVLEECKKRAFR